MSAGEKLALSFLSNTAEERVELLWIVSDRLEFCHQRGHIAIFDFNVIGFRTRPA
jgi:hypothetical protein